MSEWSSVVLEVELTPGAWTDITEFVDYDSAPVVVRQGRPTEFDDPGPGTFTFTLRNDDGRFMPGNLGSTLYPLWGKGKRVRWKVGKGGTTYTRFVGWITALQPSYPGTSTVDAIVAVTATDALGKLAQRKMLSNFTEAVLWTARNDGVRCDVYEASGTTSGLSAYLTNYSTDPSAGSPNAVFSVTDGALSFSSSNDLAAGGIVSAGSSQTAKTIPRFQANPLQIKLHVRGPGDLVPVGSVQVVASLLAGGGAPVAHLAVDVSGSNNAVYLRNADNTSTIAPLSILPFDNWAIVSALANAGTPSLSDWAVIFTDGSIATSTGVSFDVRTVGAICLPADRTPSVRASWGGIAAWGSRTLVSWRDSFVAAANGDISSRVTQLARAVDQLPVSISQVGTLTTGAATGKWSGRPALEVLQEIVRTGSGIAWARSRDSVVYAIGADQLYPASPVATIDTDADCSGTPRLVDGSEAVPTRVEIDWPGGVASVVDAAAEAAGESRSRRLTTVAPDVATAADVGIELFGRSVATDVRISQVTVDLLAGGTDHTAALFSEATDLGGLFPTQRVRLTVPASHFGTSTTDVFVQGWTETYSPSQATVTLDTTPVPDGRLLRDLVVTSGSTVVVSPSGSFTPDDVGSVITGAGIPEGTTIESVTSPTEAVISAPATQTGTTWGSVSVKMIAVDWWGGADGAAWSPRWVPGVTSTGGSATVQGGRGRLAAGSVANNGVVRRISGVTFTDGEIVVSLLFSAGGTAFVHYRADTTTASNNNYYVSLRSVRMFLGKTVGGTTTQLGTWEPATFTPGLLYRMRIRAVGSRHLVRLWQASQPEPSGWNIDATDATFAAGAIGLKGGNGATTGQYAEFDDLAVTKEG